MRRRPWDIALLLGLLIGAAPYLRADILYRVTDLGSLSDRPFNYGSYNYGYGINSAGQVTGYSNVPNTGGFHAFLYNNGQMTDLGTLTSSGYSRGYSINNAGQVAGEAQTPIGNFDAFLYTNGQMRDLGVPGFGYGINNAGQVAGYVQLSSGEHAFLYSNGQVQDLGAFGGTYSVGYGINDAGQVIGVSVTPTYALHAFLYTSGQMRDLNDLIDPTLGITLAGATAISNNGQVTGYAYTSTGPYHAFLYSNGQVQDLGALGGKPTFGKAINNAGQVVGSNGLSLYSPDRAFLYSNGQLKDLNDLIDPALGITLGEATAINDSGQIVANSAYSPTGSRAYLLTPVPEPSTWALFGVALLGLGAYWCCHPNVFYGTAQQPTK